jgi:hypothetical protein
MSVEGSGTCCEYPANRLDPDAARPVDSYEDELAETVFDNSYARASQPAALLAWTERAARLSAGAGTEEWRLEKREDDNFFAAFRADVVV